MTTRQTIKRFFEPAMDNKKVFFMSILVWIIWRVYDICVIIAFQKITKYIGLKDANGVFSVFIIFLIGLGCYHVMNYILTRNVVRLESLIYKSILKEYLPKFSLLDNSEIEKNGIGKNISIFDSGTNSWSSSIMDVTMNGVGFIVVFFYSIYQISDLGYKFVIAFLAVVIGFDLIAVVLKDLGNKYRITKYELIKEKTKQIVRFIMQKNEILQQDKALLETNNILDIVDKYTDEGFKKRTYEHRAFNSIEIGIVIAKISALYFIGIKVINQQIGYDLYLGIVLIIGLFGSVTNDGIKVIKTFIKEGYKITYFRNFMEKTPNIVGYDTGNIFEYKIGNINLDNISFGYSKDKKLFDNFSINISGSTKTALVGPSGGGKSTLIKLIAGYIRPDDGDIYIDDQNLMDISLKSYYSHVGYLTQEPSVFDGTIRENLMYGLAFEDSQKILSEDSLKNIQTSEKLSEQIIGNSSDIDNVIKLSRCERIYDLPNGLNTEIGERGIRLSGGQRQRLAIAKIMLKNPNIILLDEPTSALDSENEELVTQALNNLFAGKTVIVIAHRLQTVKHADQIIYINNGQVIESGTHKELLNLGGEYAKMVELQSGF